MGLFDSVGNFLDTAVSDVTGLFTSAPDVTSVGGLSLPGAPVPVSYPSYSAPPDIGIGGAQPVMESAPMVMRSIAAGLPRWAALLPTLWQFVRTKFPALAPARAVQGLLSLLRKYGPTALAGFVGSAVLNELMQYSVLKKRRRMNVANSRALRRSLRRLNGFEKLAHRVSAQLSRQASRGRSRRSSRCPACRHSPCTC